MRSFYLLAILLFVMSPVNSQGMKSFRVGHPVSVSLPDYMMRTLGVNDNAIFQYKSEAKGIYGFVIEDNKEEMKLADLEYSSIGEFYESFIKDFIEGEEKVNKSNPVSTKKGDLNYLEADVSMLDKESKMEIYYHIGIVETKLAFYKVISYCSLDSKSKYKEDIRKILYSLKDN